MIGERLLDLRKDAGLTQDALSEIIHINKHSISSYERDKSKPPDEVKVKLAGYFGVSIDYLLSMADNPSLLCQERKFVPLPPDFPEEAMGDLKD